MIRDTFMRGHALVAPVDFTSAARASNVYTLPAWLTLTCATTGRTVQTAAATLATGLGANAARARSVNGTTFGLALEAARTNVLLRSSEFDNASWTKLNAVSVVADAGTGPEGTATADSIVNASGSNVVRQTTATTAQSLSWNFSLWMFCASTCNVFNRILKADASGVAAQVNRNLALGAWDRVDIGVALGATPTGVVRCDFLDVSSQDFLAWGAQAENSLYPSSHIPTAGTAVARAADVLSCSAPAVARGGYFNMRMSVAPNYTQAEQAVDHDLFYLDDDNRVFVQQSTSKVVLRVGGADVLSSALTWSRNQAITVNAVHDRKRGRVLSVSGATTGDGVAVGAIASAVSLPATAYLCGNASGPQECADLRSILFSRPL